jgi:hypothetical protein
MSGPEEEPVGSLTEEALKLLHAVQGWAKESGSDYAGAAGTAASMAATIYGQVNEHIATGGRECTYCPLCRAIAAVRGTSPEVRQHLSAAASSLMHAAAEVMATDVPARRDRDEETTVTKIDIEDDDGQEY